MLFNSIEFAIFFVSFFFLYWFRFNKKLKAQNLLILIGSYAFYAWWDWRFLSLLIGSSFVNYLLGIYIYKSTSKRKRKGFVFLGVLCAILSLSYFKYTNFFITSLIDAFAYFDIHLSIHTLKIILPLGISFYTFRMLSYILDINNGKIKPTTNWVVFFSYVAFFPSLISGPIDRSKLIIPQLENNRIFNFNQAADGMRQILWGLFKKIVIANNCAEITNTIFENYEVLPPDTLIFGAFYYTIQLYADFSGYSDMAIGIAHLLGFNITKNFNYPFFSQNMAIYWRNWHISLTSWLTDYVFTPLSIRFRDLGNWGLILAIIINFILVGIWHGANWTFVLFGFLNGCYFIPLILNKTINKKKKVAQGRRLPSFKELRNIVGTFILVVFTNILFRADSISQAGEYIKNIFSQARITSFQQIDSFHVFDFFHSSKELLVLFLILFLFVMEWIGREEEHALAHFGLKWKKTAKWTFYYAMVFIILFFAGDKQEFIYFQF